MLNKLARNACLFMVCILLTTACTESSPPLPRLHDDAVILAFGDSLTSGNGADNNKSYTAILAELLDRKVINAGVPGEFSAQAKQRLPEILEKHSPDLLILCHGGNDLLRKLKRSDTRDNIEYMVATAVHRKLPVGLIGVPEPGLVLLESADLYNEIAEKYSLPYDGDILPEIESDNSLKSDQIHPNAEGYQKLAIAIFRLLEDSGAIH